MIAHLRGRCLGPAIVYVLLAVASVQAAEKKLKLEEIFSEEGLTKPNPTQLRWRTDGNLLTYILDRDSREGRDLWAVDPESGEKRVLVSDQQLRQLAPPAKEAVADERERERVLRYSVASYLWSPDSKSLLFASGGRLYLYDVAAARARAVAPEKQNVRDPKFSPNGRWISFVYEHDLWLAPTSGGEERRLTRGASDTLLHGDLDWVYPEEFGVRSGYHWAPDSRRIAFLEIDQSRVPTYPITDLLALPPAVDFQRYPLAGASNPRVRVGIVEAAPSETRQAPVTWLQNDAEYTPRVAWANNDWLAVQFLNREQTRLELVFADAANGRTRPVLVEQDPHWINVSDDLIFLESQRFLWTSERTGFRHISVHGFDGRKRQILTDGEWEVKEIHGVDEEAGWIYYSSNEANALGSDLYRLRWDTGAKEKLTSGRGLHQIVLNEPATAYADTHSALTTPPRTEVRHLPSGQHTNIHQAGHLAEYGLVTPKLLEWEAPDGALIRGLLLKSDPLQPEKKYPVVIYVYGGPRAPTIRDAWGDRRGRHLFHQYLAQQGYVVFQIDDRASSILGHKHEKALHLSYGPTALADYEVAVGKIKQMDFVDPERIAIWGWSGGGFSACFALTHSELFKIGIAVAPVTDWRLYDTIYTERYMGLPAEQSEAYEKTSCVAAAGNLHGHMLLAHGTADDNVHIQNTVQMIHALIEEGKPYDLAIYPGKTHSLHGAKARLHLFRAIESYLKEHL